jgi:Ras-related protein Rab-5C
MAQPPPIVVISGDTAVGKTVLCHRLKANEYDDSGAATIGVASFTLELEGVTFDFRDTAGQERYRSLTSVFYRGAAVAILAYDISRAGTLDAITGFHATLMDVSPSAKVILIGLKLDLQDEGKRAVDGQKAEDFAKQLKPPPFAILEASALNEQGISDLKAALVNAVKDNPNGAGGPQGIDVAGTSKKGSKKGCC